MYLTILVMMAILLIMLITKTQKQVILRAEFEIIILIPGSILYLPNTSYSITRRPTVVGTKGTGQF